ncbi:MAG: hypothetical protein NTV09_00900 [Bacteroidetes bacterium]|nr:hypothetical protein [Bacteroidota bacterium]
MKSILLILQFLCLTGLLFGQTVPPFTGETLENKTITIPSDTKGKYTLLCFASSMKAQEALEGWLDPVYNKFIAKTGLMDDFYDLNVFFIPVFKGSNASMQGTVKKKFNETAQADIKGHVLFCNSDLGEVTTALHLQNDDTPYFFLLDTTGNIVYHTSGAFSEEKFDALDDKIE